MPDLNALMKQAQALQSNVAKVQEEIAKMTVDASSGGGMVTVTVNGQFELVKLTIEKTVVDPADVGMLQDLVIAAINQAVAKMRDLSKEKMAGAMGGMNIPGMPGLF
jgi:DNA-binding YbaB/EbfC family protein